MEKKYKNNVDNLSKLTYTIISYLAPGSRSPKHIGCFETWGFCLYGGKMSKVAILVDGGFYKKRAKFLFGDKSPQERADELFLYCCRHIGEKNSYGKSEKASSAKNELYRIFYYDCHPSEKNVYHPLLKRTIDLKKEPTYKWNEDFFMALMTKRKLALRMGEILESSVGYVISESATKKLCNQTITVDDLTEKDFTLDITQKGVDMRIGLDIAALAYKKLVDKIVLIAGDSDFVPAAKHARREGIDFVLDPLWQSIKPSLQEHIDGLESKTQKPGTGGNDTLRNTGYTPPLLN